MDACPQDELVSHFGLGGASTHGQELAGRLQRLHPPVGAYSSDD